MSKVFISYSHVDTEVATELAAILAELNIDHFLDRKEINWGNSITTKVQDGLDGCVAILVIVSPASLKSHWVPYEIGQVSALRKIILPFLTHPSIELPLYISSLNHVATFEQVREYFAEKFHQEAKNVLESNESTVTNENEHSGAKTVTFDISSWKGNYLMEISRPRNDGMAYLAFLKRPGRDNAGFRETLEMFYQYQLMDFDGESYNLTTKGWNMADQLWCLRILDALEPEVFVKENVLADRVELTDGESELKELRRLVEILKENECVNVGQHEDQVVIIILEKGLAERESRSISIS